MPTTEGPMPENVVRERNKPLDGLRAIAVIAVVAFNYFKTRIKAYNQEMIVAANQMAEMLHFHNTGSPIPTDLYQPVK